MDLKPDETDLIGAWTVANGHADGDSIEKRIISLIANYLQKVAVSAESDGWDVLYRDPADGRFWELTYPQGHMHGGGPKRLTALSPSSAKSKYRLDL